MQKVRNATSVIIVGILAVAIFLALAPSHAQQFPAGQTAKIAVVDVPKALTECLENKAREEYSEELNVKIRAEMERLGRESDEIRLELENALEPDSDAYKARLRDFFDKAALRESYQKYQEQVLTTEAQVWIEKLYQKFLDEVARVAQADGIGLVLGKDATPIQARSRGDITSLIRTRKVLYNSQFLDITGKVMTNMDRAYEKEKLDKAKASVK